ncbi:MAG: flavin reductase family protein [Acidimicrobiales bacterium]
MARAETDETCAGHLDIESFKEAMGSFATGVAVVTALDAEGPVGFTCQSLVSLSLDPAFVALAPAKSSTSWPRIAQAGHFCVNVLAVDQAVLGRRFALSGGDKFSGVSWRGEKTGAPVLAGVLAWVDCRLEVVHEAGDHEIVIGRVLDVGIDREKTGPLLYFQSRFRRIGSPVPGGPGAGLGESENGGAALGKEESLG